MTAPPPDEPLAPLSADDLAMIAAAANGLLSDPASLERPSGQARARFVLEHPPRLLAQAQRMAVLREQSQEIKCICPHGWLSANYGWHRGPNFCPRYELDQAERARRAERARSKPHD